MGTTALPHSLTENEQFLAYMYCVNPEHVVPKKTAVVSDIVALADEGKTILKKVMMTSSSRIHLTVDIWSKKGLTSSYIGVTGHFLIMVVNGPEKRAQMQACVLELIEFENPHTGYRIAVELLRVLKEWGIMERVGFILTDNGSNMIRLFKDAKSIMEKQAKEDAHRQRRQEAAEVELSSSDLSDEDAVENIASDSDTVTAPEEQTMIADADEECYEEDLQDASTETEMEYFPDATSLPGGLAETSSLPNSV